MYYHYMDDTFVVFNNEREGSMFLWHDHFGMAHFVVALFGVAHVVLVHFGADLFCANFTKIIFLFFSSIFLINKKIFRLFQLFFSKTIEDFFLFLINFFPFHIKKYKFKHIVTVFLFGYSSNR